MLSQSIEQFLTLIRQNFILTSFRHGHKTIPKVFVWERVKLQEREKLELNC